MVSPEVQQNVMEYKVSSKLTVKSAEEVWVLIGAYGPGSEREEVEELFCRGVDECTCAVLE